MATRAKCPHCNQKTVLEERARFKISEVQVADDVPMFETEEALVQQCVSCDGLVVTQISLADWLEPGDEIVRRLYPAGDQSDNSVLPQRVRAAYEAALSVRTIEPNAYAVLIGRLLETICAEEGAQGSRLVDKLTWLAENGRMPPLLAQMTDLLRLIRNVGAHAEAGHVQSADVPAISEFTEAIVEYLYRAPAKLEAVRQRVETRKRRPPPKPGATA